MAWDERIDADLWRVKRGDMSFARCEAAHRGLWASMARRVQSRWRLPAWYSEEDVRQEILIGVWRHIGKYDPSYPKAPKIAGYVLWNAFDAAKKAAHKARNAKRSGNKADSNPSRYERPFCEYCLDEEDDVLDVLARRMGLGPEAPVNEADQEARLSRAEAVGNFAEDYAETRAERALVWAAERAGVLIPALLGDPHAIAEATLALEGGRIGAREAKEKVSRMVGAQMGIAARLADSVAA